MNSVLGSPVRNPQDARTIALRARALGLTSTVGILHDGSGRLRPLTPEHLNIYRELVQPRQAMFSFAQYDRFQNNISQGLPNLWHCRAGGRFLYICEDGLVHYCSQQRGRPGIPLDQYTRQDLEREASVEKPCAPYCTVSCVHQTAMLDASAKTRGRFCSKWSLRREEREPGYRPPARDCTDLDVPRRAREAVLSKLALRL